LDHYEKSTNYVIAKNINHREDKMITAKAIPKPTKKKKKLRDENAPKKLRGFAAMSAERRKQVATLGGLSVPKEKRTFSNKAIAIKAGKIGGKNVPDEKRSFSVDRELASRAGTAARSKVDG